MSVDTVDVASAHKVRMADLARLAGVSIATVSRALNDSPLINRVTKSRVWQVACDHGYAIGHAMPEALREATRTVAVIVPFGDRQDHQAILCGLFAAARDIRCHLLISHMAPQDPVGLRAVLLQMEADAFLFLGDEGMEPALNSLADHHRLLVWGDNGHNAHYDSIGPDNFACGAKATAHLAAQGCRRIAYLGDIAGAALQQRFMGYLTALNESGLRFDSGLMRQDPPTRGDGIDAVFIAGEPGQPLLARVMGLGVPVVACSQTLRAGQSLATVSIDTDAAARVLIERLLRQNGGPHCPIEHFPIFLNV